MALQQIKLAPGIHREGTAYAAAVSWFRSQLVRFRNEFPEKMGGWSRATTSMFSGVCRFLRRFSINSGGTYTGIGTSTKFYVETGGVLTDVTPLRNTNALGATPITTTNLSSIVRVHDVGHGALVGDTIIVSGAAAFNGIAAANLNIETTILTVTGADDYTYDTGDAANASGSGGGGGVTVKYLITPGGDGYPGGAGWGAGTFGRGAWGSAVDLSSLPGGGYIAQWSGETYGEDLIINPRFGGLYYWDASSPTARAVNFTALAGASHVPTVAIRTIVSQKDRHIICFGVNADGLTAVDRMLVRWSDDESATEWQATTITTAGDKRLTRGSTIVTAIPTRQSILIWTDTSLYSMTWVGGEFVFSFDLVAEFSDIEGFNSAVEANDIVYWLGHSGIYRYAGDVRQLDCDIQDYVLGNIDFNNSDKIVAGTNIAFNEIIWFYTSLDSSDGEPDKYVVYNYENNIWYYGSLARSYWKDATFSDNPIAASTDGYVYFHEFGADDGSTNPATAIDAYIESSPFELDVGDSFSFISRIIHDITFRGESGTTAPTATLTLTGQDYPGGSTTQTAAVTVTRATDESGDSPETFTTQSFVRLRGRQFRLKVESSGLGSLWRFGYPRIEIRTDGKR